MKKILIYVSIGVVIFTGFITTLILKNSNNGMADSIVYIESLNEETIKQGLGFVYKVDKSRNYIVTCYHVIDGYDDIYIYNKDKEKVKAEVFKYDEYTDIAILVIEDKLNLKEISIGDSEELKDSDDVSTPSNSDINKFIEGNILSKSEDIKINGTKFNTIEVEINVDYGNSGGPLLNENNEVIGVLFVMDDRESIENAYALPINFVMDIVDKLEKNEIKRPNLGAVMCNTTNTILLDEYDIKVTRDNGVVLLEINEGYSLDKSNLQKGDVIIKFAGDVINDITDLKDVLYKKDIGDVVEIEFYRDDKIYNTMVEL